MDGYVRVSRVGGREGDAFISPTVQRTQIQAWAALRGVEIIAWHEDLDQSGGKLRRPGLDALLERVENGSTDGVAVAKLDRLSRLGVADALKLVARITDAGGSVAAVDLGVDPTTPTGELLTTLLLALAAMTRRQLGDSWATAQRLAIERGAHIGRAPYGYQRGTGGVLEPHPVDSFHLQHAYSLAATQSMGAAARYLAGHTDKRWTASTVRALLARRTYLGESRVGKLVNHEAHEPLISREVWEAAQRKPRVQARVTGSHPLSGIARCGTCRAPLTGGSKTRLGQRMYLCSAAQTQYAGPRCSRPASIVAERLEGHVRDTLQPILARFTVDSVQDSGSLTTAAERLADAESELQAFAADLTARRTLGERYHENLTIRAEAVEQAQAAYRELAGRAQALNTLDASTILDDPQMLGPVLSGMGLTLTVAAGRGTLEERIRLLPADG